MHVKREALRMTDAEVDSYIAANQFGRLASVNPEGEPHVTPIGYVDWNGAIYFLSMRRSRRSRDLASNPKVSMCIDDGVSAGEDYTQRRGVVLYGRCVLADEDESTLEIVRARFADRQGLRADESARTTHDWYRVDVDRRVSWDFRRIPPGADFKADRIRGATSDRPSEPANG